MYHKKMFIDHVGRPFVEAFAGMFEYASVKLLLLLGSLPALLGLDLFNTPQLWWQGLLYLAIFDWLGGCANAIYRGRFSWNVATRKWYQATGYLLVCGSAAILSNTFPSLFYYFQFIVYAGFYLKEFVSLLRTFRLISMFEVMWDVVTSGRIDLDSFQKFRNEVDRRYDEAEDREHKVISEHDRRYEKKMEENLS